MVDTDPVMCLEEDVRIEADKRTVDIFFRIISQSKKVKSHCIKHDVIRPMYREIAIWRSRVRKKDRNVEAWVSEEEISEIRRQLEATESAYREIRFEYRNTPCTCF